MENQKSSAKQVMINYGLYIGLASILINVINYAVGDVYRPHWIISVAGIVISIVLIVLALKKFKDGNEGLMSLSQALKVGLGASLISAIIVLIYMFAFSNFIEPDFYANMAEVAYQTNVVEKYPNMTDEQLEAARANVETFTSPGMNSAMILIFSLFFGFIISLIAGLIMKRTEEDR